MDVDLLRPGTVPIAPGTVLWFEFLLHEDLLLKHLQKPNPEPTATELITKFSDGIIETLRNREEANPQAEPVGSMLEQQGDHTRHPVKNIALKLLSLKVAAFLKWDLTQIRSIPFKTQVHLLQDLLYFTNNETNAEIPNIEPVDLDAAPPHYKFALLVYHRWFLNITMHRITSNWHLKIGGAEISPAEENVICSPDNVNKTVDFLTNALNWNQVPHMLTFDCFKVPTEENTALEFNWNCAQPISKEEFQTQISYDLGTFFFYKENYELAKEHFLKCKASINAIKENNGFMNVNGEVLEVYVNACVGPTEGVESNLLEQLNTSIVNQYNNLTTILHQDNVAKQIPLQHRLNIEFDIQGALSSGLYTVARDLLAKVRSLNIIRCILDQKPLPHHTINLIKSGDTFVKILETSWNSFNNDDKKLLKNFLIDTILKKDVPDLFNSIQANPTLGQIFEKSEIAFIKQSEPSLDIPESLNKSDWTFYDFTKSRKPKLELKQLEKRLIATYDPKEIRDLITKISMNPLTTGIWGINPRWELPIPLESVLRSLPRCFIQDFGLVMLSKAREQMLRKNWNSSLELMLILDKELDPPNNKNTNIPKLSRLISWEVLLVQVTQLVEEWPKGSVDKVALANACEACIQTNESVLPRTEIIEQCVICLLNLGRWEFLVNCTCDKRWPSYDITYAIALASQEFIKHKGSKKLSKNLWDIVLPIFTSPPSTQSKRSNVGPSSGFIDNQITTLQKNVMAIFGKLRDSTVLTIVISMLTRLYNVLKDESSLELQVEYANLWPAVISNANSYNTKTASEMLTQIVKLALVHYPNNYSWLRLMGDIHFASGVYNAAMRNYLMSLSVYYDYFNIPVRHDDHIYRRMIKCCIGLNCFTQAAVLCQFLEEPDYQLAFKVLSEQKPCFDAADGYYHCFWDTSILEYIIHLHHKKGENGKKKIAMQMMGLLELNSNNNEEIQREASNRRKALFLRALCKTYVFK